MARPSFEYRPGLAGDRSLPDFRLAARYSLPAVLPATAEQLSLFHTTAYISALQDAERDSGVRCRPYGTTPDRAGQQPDFCRCLPAAGTAAAASLTAADMLYDGQASRIFNPSGGTHHGLPDKANGFCFVNDPALALLRLLERGAQKVAYIDIDAHHPDGVQAHLSGDERVRLWSVHEANKWPRTGPAGDTGNGFARNFTLQRGAGDDQLLGCIRAEILPELTSFNPIY